MQPRSCQKHEAEVKCPDCQCPRESSRQLPRYAWVVAAGLVLGILVLLLGLQKCGQVG